MKKKISLQDIAESLGVSKSLVSMVLNNKAEENGISKITQQRVWEKIKELNYKPNMMARGLRLGKSNTIGLIVSDIANPFYSKIARHIEDFLEEKGYSLIICSTDEDVEKEQKLIHMLKDRQVDGLIISSSQKSNAEFKALLEEKYPFVLIDRSIPDILSNTVTVNNFKGAYEGVSHLILQGYRNIAAFAVSPFHVSTINHRLEGYYRALRDHGLSYGKRLMAEIPFDDVKNAVKKEIKSMLNGPNKIDALFAVNGNIAIACLETLHEMKIRLPEDIALLCFDDLEFFKFNNPSITAVAQPIEELSINAVQILLEELKSKEEVRSKKTIELSTSLNIRRSTIK